MTIGSLAAQTGVPASTIRYYEKLSLLPRPQRVSGQRRYGPGAMERLALLRLAQSCGFRLEEMQILVHGFEPGVKPSVRWQKLAIEKRQEIDQQIERLVSMRQLVDDVLNCRCADLKECARTSCKKENS